MIQFEGPVNSDEAADAFMLAFLAARKGAPVSAQQVWKSLQSRGLFPGDGRSTGSKDPDEGAATAEIERRLSLLFEKGEIGGLRSRTSNRRTILLGVG